MLQWSIFLSEKPKVGSLPILFYMYESMNIKCNRYFIYVNLLADVLKYLSGKVI